MKSGIIKMNEKMMDFQEKQYSKRTDAEYNYESKKLKTQKKRLKMERHFNVSLNPRANMGSGSQWFPDSHYYFEVPSSPHSSRSTSDSNSDESNEDSG